MRVTEPSITADAQSPSTPLLVERGNCLLDGVIGTREVPVFAAMDSIHPYILTRSVGASANSSGSLYWKPFASVSARIAITS